MNKKINPRISRRASLLRPMILVPALFFAWVPGFPLGLLTAYLLKEVVGFKVSLVAIGIFALILGPAVGLAVIYQISKKALKNTEYVLSEKTVNATSGLLSTTTQSFKYSDIVSMSLYQSIGQKKASVADISIQTASENSIRLWNIPNYKDVYDFINEKRD